MPFFNQISNEWEYEEGDAPTKQSVVQMPANHSSVIKLFNKPQPIDTYTSTLSTSTTTALKVRTNNVDRVVVTDASTNITNDVVLPMNGNIYIGAAGSANYTRMHTASGGSYFDFVGGSMFWRFGSANRMTLSTAGLLTTNGMQVNGNLGLTGTISRVYTPDKVLSLASVSTTAASLNDAGMYLGTGANQVKIVYKTAENALIANKAIEAPYLAAGISVEAPYVTADVSVETPVLKSFDNFGNSASWSLVDDTLRIAKFTDVNTIPDSSITLDAAAVTISPNIVTPNGVIANTLTAEYEVQTRQLTSLPTFEGNGYASWELDSGTQATDANGIVTVSPSSLNIIKYTVENVPGTAIHLGDENMTLSANEIIINGDLRLAGSDKTVQEEFNNLGITIATEAAGLLANYGIDAAQQVLITKLLAALLKPAGYEKLPDTPDDEDFPDSQNLAPIRCFAAGTFNDLNDAGEIIASRVNTKGKMTVNCDIMPTRVLTLAGDSLFTTKDADDEFETQMHTRLGSKVALYNEQQVLTNPLAVCCRLGTNSLVTASGQLQAAEVVTDTLKCYTINGVNVKKLLQPMIPPKDYGNEIAYLNDVVNFLPLPVKPVVVPPRSYSKDIAFLNDAVNAIDTSKQVILPSRSYSKDIAFLNDAINSMPNSLLPALPSRNYTKAIAEVRAQVEANSAVSDMNPVVPSIDWRNALKPVRALTNTMSTYTSSLSASTTTVLNVSGTSNFSNKLFIDPTNTGSGASWGIGFATNNPFWGIYRAISGAGRSFAGATAVVFGGLSNYCIRFRCWNGAAQGFIWENSSENGLMSLHGQTGALTTAGDITTPVGTSLYVGPSSGVYTRVHTATGASAGSYIDWLNAANPLYIRNGSSTRLTLASTGLMTINSMNCTGAATVGGNLTVNGNLLITGRVDTVNTTTINVEDKLVVLANTTTDPILLNGGGIQLGTGASASTLLYNNTTDSWVMNKPLTVPNITPTGGFPDQTAAIRPQPKLQTLDWLKPLRALRSIVTTIGAYTSTLSTSTSTLLTVSNALTVVGDTLLSTLNVTGRLVCTTLKLSQGADQSWAIYLNPSGAGNSFIGGVATAFAGISSFAMRFRCRADTTEGVLFENHQEKALFAINGSSGDVTLCNTASLTFDSQTDKTQLRLWGGEAYSIGVQSSTLYMRSNNNFAFYKGGSHNSGILNAGGGTQLMRLTDTGDLHLPVDNSSLFVGDINNSSLRLHATDSAEVDGNGYGCYIDFGQKQAPTNDLNQRLHFRTNRDTVIQMSIGHQGDLSVRGMVQSSGVYTREINHRWSYAGTRRVAGVAGGPETFFRVATGKTFQARTSETRVRTCMKMYITSGTGNDYVWCDLILRRTDTNQDAAMISEGGHMLFGTRTTTDKTTESLNTVGRTWSTVPSAFYEIQIAEGYGSVMDDSFYVVVDGFTVLMF